FLLCVAPPPALHSFPTRRSSDLSAVFGRAGAVLHREDVCELLAAVRDEPLDLRVDPGRAVGLEALLHPAEHGAEQLLRPRIADRSEEHTSELQSPYDLVCRLLLE